MRALKPSWLKGVITIKVKGHYPERFFDLCTRHEIKGWSIKKISNTECLGDINLSDLKRVRQLRRKTRYKLSFVSKKGLPFLFSQLQKMKILVLSFWVAFLIFIYLSQSIWMINIDGIPVETEKQLRQSLDEYGVKKGRLKLFIEDSSAIQQRLLADYPNLLWVGIKQDGIIYKLDVVPKRQVDEEELINREHLYAKKDGVISEMFVAKGRPLVEINDYVKKGQLLVTGELNQKDEKDEDEKDEKDEGSKELSTVEAEIYATTWYESKLNIPLVGQYQTETGNQSKKYSLQIGRFQLPFWGFWSNDFDLQQVETTLYKPSIGSWQLPIAFSVDQHREMLNTEVNRTEEEAIEVGMVQARENLLNELGASAEIINEKILHQSIENGKVNLHVYFTVKEDIVNTNAMNQGD
ncbi:sporulation protein YqfD [Amphibacillus jilinensis]|uniref:sporulation protein YqfD n=1 Tax=Amphibacillus jilinensis TaxID=1216008 RepID=UPI00031C7577|nr:sporulation protein YqfD [Amphibacillus jilinensis]